MLQMSNFIYSNISKHNNWSTPKALYEALDKEFHFQDDPCPLYGDKTTEDGLVRHWKSPAFMNPPYERYVIDRWVQKAYEESQLGCTVVGLLRGDTSTRWFHEWVWNKAEFVPLRGRLKFGNSKTSPPFPSIIAIWRS